MLSACAARHFDPNTKEQQQGSLLRRKSFYMRVAILWSRMSGAMDACFKAYAGRFGAQLMAVVQPQQANAPYDMDAFAWYDRIVEYRDGSDYAALFNAVADFRPEAIFMSSWAYPDYMRLCRSPLFRSLPRIAAADNQWHGTMRQYAGRIISPIYVKRSIDRFFVPGERQLDFCAKIGYGRDLVATGLYSCDSPKFNAIYRSVPLRERPTAFLYVGRLVREKGIDDLIAAYDAYRKIVPEPYSLICVGAGPLADTLAKMPGISVHDFVQPLKLPEWYAKASCFVLASTFEPWGIVVHEAVSAGLPTICTSACGASVHLVREGYNGYVVMPGRPDQLADAMKEFTLLADTEKAAMSDGSFSLSMQFSPEIWARTFRNLILRTAR